MSRFVPPFEVPNRRSRSERGYVTVEFIGAVGLLLVPIALLVLVFPTWAERQGMARVAAREAARAYVLTGDTARAGAVVDEIAANYNFDRADVSGPVLTGDPRSRGGEVTATVDIRVPVTNIPLLNLDADAFTLTGRHTEVVDRYRSFDQ